MFIIRNFILVALIFISSFAFTKEYIIGFGSCIDEKFPQPIWSSIQSKDVDAFMFLGDNVYGDDPSGDLKKLKQSYKVQASKFQESYKDKKVICICDDHDYGIYEVGAVF